MKLLPKYILFLLLGGLSLQLRAQVMVEDTSTNQAFFKAKKFKSGCYVGFEGNATQILKKNAALNLAVSLNWVINHKYVVSAKYYGLTTPLNVQKIVAADRPGDTINLTHHFAGLGFSYILFSDKKFSFQPEVTAGWGGIKYTGGGKTYRKDFAEIIPAVYGVYNASKYFRIGAGLNYRITAGASLNGLKDGHVGGVGGIVFIRIGTF